MKKTALIALMLAVLLFATALLGACKPKKKAGSETSETPASDEQTTDASTGDNDSEWDPNW